MPTTQTSLAVTVPQIFPSREQNAALVSLGQPQTLGTPPREPPVKAHRPWEHCWPVTQTSQLFPPRPHACVVAAVMQKSFWQHPAQLAIEHARRPGAGLQPAALTSRTTKRARSAVDMERVTASRGTGDRIERNTENGPAAR